MGHCRWILVWRFCLTFQNEILSTLSHAVCMHSPLWTSTYFYSKRHKYHGLFWSWILANFHYESVQMRFAAADSSLIYTFFLILMPMGGHCTFLHRRIFIFSRAQRYNDTAIVFGKVDKDGKKWWLSANSTIPVVASVTHLRSPLIIDWKKVPTEYKDNKNNRLLLKGSFYGAILGGRLDLIGFNGVRDCFAIQDAVSCWFSVTASWSHWFLELLRLHGVIEIKPLRGFITEIADNHKKFQVTPYCLAVVWRQIYRKSDITCM